VKAESIQKALHAQPFRPFRLIMTHGERLPVSHPEWVLLPPGARTVVVMEPDESVRILDVGLLQGLEQGPPVPAGTIAADPNGGG
jgi:hypothetical protein